MAAVRALARRRIVRSQPRQPRRDFFSSAPSQIRTNFLSVPLARHVRPSVPSLRTPWAWLKHFSTEAAQPFASIEPKYNIQFTCKKCSTRSSKTFSKQSYHKGVVIIRCPGCRNLHLIADNLGWFGDNKINIETLMEEQNEAVKRGLVTPAALQDLDEGLLELSPEQAAQLASEQTQTSQSPPQQTDTAEPKTS